MLCIIFNTMPPSWSQRRAGVACKALFTSFLEKGSKTPWSFSQPITEFFQTLQGVFVKTSGSLG